MLGVITECFTDKSENARDAIFSHVYLKTDFGGTCPIFDTTVNTYRIILCSRHVILSEIDEICP